MKRPHNYLLILYSYCIHVTYSPSSLSMEIVCDTVLQFLFRFIVLYSYPLFQHRLQSMAQGSILSTDAAEEQGIRLRAGGGKG